LSGEKAQARYKTFTQLCCIALVCFGISMYSLPAALIVGGVVLCAALEVR
jgi:hypothetical protein